MAVYTTGVAHLCFAVRCAATFVPSAGRSTSFRKVMLRILRVTIFTTTFESLDFSEKLGEKVAEVPEKESVSPLFASGREGAVLERDRAGKGPPSLPEPPGSKVVANFCQMLGKFSLVFGCIGTDLCKQIRVLQHFSKSIKIYLVVSTRLSS